MTSKMLSRMYDVLSAEERTSLQFAASDRDDETEVNRLINSAPRVRRVQPHHYNVLKARVMLAMMFRLEQLESIAAYWFARGQYSVESQDGVEDAADWINVAAGHAYRYSVNAEAWRRFCDEMAIDSDQLLQGMTGDWLCGLGDLNMPKSAPRQAKLAEMLPKLGAKEDVVTSDILLKQWRTLFGELLGDQ